MFGSKNVPQPVEQQKKATDTSLSTIAKGLNVSGEITGKGNVCIEGNFKGNITCNKLIVGNEGSLDGRITADELIVYGKFKGEATAKTVRLMNSAIVTGDVYHDILEVAAGAKVDGRYSREMGQDAVQSPLVGAKGNTVPLKAVDGGKKSYTGAAE